jgi:cytochrome c biogenesis protein CcmG, thiol:disulfide interchange protein DsbE
MYAVRAVSVAVVVALLGLLIWNVAHNSGGGIAAKVDRGDTVTAPPLTLPTFAPSQDLSLASYRGKVVVINFWASWCVDCKLEAHALAASEKQWSGKNVVFLGVDAQDLGSAAQKYMRHYDVDYPVVRDISGNAVKTWGVTGFPETFFVTPSGQVVPPHYAGPVTVADLSSAIKQALTS